MSRQTTERGRETRLRDRAYYVLQRCDPSGALGVDAPKDGKCVGMMRTRVGGEPGDKGRKMTKRRKMSTRARRTFLVFQFVVVAVNNKREAKTQDERGD